MPDAPDFDIVQVRGLLEADAWPVDPRTDIDTASLVRRFPYLGSVRVEDIEVPTEWGSLSARLYTTTGATDPAALVWVHGGAFLFGSIDMPEANWVALELATRGVNVLTLQYRKAIRDVHWAEMTSDIRAGWNWAAEHYRRLGVPAESLNLGGASAGAALTAALTRQLVDAAEPLPASVVWVYPLVHPELPPAGADLAPALALVEEGFNADVVRSLNLNYAGGEKDLVNPHAFAGIDVPAGHPPTLIINAESDNLRPSGELFATQLRNAGNNIEVTFEPNTQHGYLDLPESEAARRSLDTMAAWLQRGAVRG